MQGSIVFEPGTALVLDRSAFVLDGVDMTSTAGWTARIDEGRFATRQTEGQENATISGSRPTGCARPSRFLPRWTRPACCQR
jgi:hypothetical protein